MKKNNPLFDRITAYCQHFSLIQPGSTLIIGLSGGPDSVFLFDYLAWLAPQKQLKLIAAHLDHGWRPESTNDAQFCQELTNQYKAPFILRNLKDAQADFKQNGSKEELGRKARRAFFEQVAREHGAFAIALAHHADDQMETFIMRMIRGASLTGLAGIKPKDGLYIRPLLGLIKQEILEYLHEHKIPYVTDASNQSDEYLRNRIRNTVIPAIKVCDNRFENNFATTHTKLVETEEFLQELAASALANISDENNTVDIQKLLALHPVVRNRLLINWLIMHKVPFTPSQGLLDEIVRFLENSKSNTHTLHNQWCLHKTLGKITLNKNL